MHAYISKNTYWRNGVVLIAENGQNRALVKADSEDRKIFIHLSGRKPSRRQFLEIIRADFLKIHQSIPDIKVTQIVPLPDHPGIFVDYKYLLDLEMIGEDYFVPVGLLEKVSVKQLLDGIDVRKPEPKKQPSKIDTRAKKLKRLEILYDNLQHLQEQRALHGPLDVPVKLASGIRLTLQEISELEEELQSET